MKNYILLPVLGLGIVFLVMSSKPETAEASRVIVQTNVVPVQVAEGFKIGGFNRVAVRWVQVKKPVGGNLTFYANETDLENIMVKLVNLTRDYSRMKDGKFVNCSWLLEKERDVKYLKLVYPVLGVTNGRVDGC